MDPNLSSGKFGGKRTGGLERDENPRIAILLTVFVLSRVRTQNRVPLLLDTL